ncbi:hypothetical protein H0H93_000813 [Arthromyces matolae]|nr:hypothetical protein H0H93_000813 [Arthromyces matolae]
MIVSSISVTNKPPMKTPLAQAILAQLFSVTLACYNGDSQRGNTEDVDILHMISIPDDSNACIHLSDPSIPGLSPFSQEIHSPIDNEGIPFDVVGISKRQLRQRKKGVVTPAASGTNKSGTSAHEKDMQNGIHPPSSKSTAIRDGHEWETEPSDEEIDRAIEDWLERFIHEHQEPSRTSGEMKHPGIDSDTYVLLPNMVDGTVDLSAPSQDSSTHNVQQAKDVHVANASLMVLTVSAHRRKLQYSAIRWSERERRESTFPSFTTSTLGLLIAGGVCGHRHHSASGFGIWHAFGGDIKAACESKSETGPFKTISLFVYESDLLTTNELLRKGVSRNGWSLKLKVTEGIVEYKDESKTISAPIEVYAATPRHGSPNVEMPGSSGIYLPIYQAGPPSH